MDDGFGFMMVLFGAQQLYANQFLLGLEALSVVRPPQVDILFTAYHEELI